MNRTAEAGRAFPIALAAATFGRILLNTARRFVYPFAPVLCRGLGVPLTAVTSLVAVNQITGVLGIFFGPLSDRFGCRRMMLFGMGLLAAGMMTAAFFPFFGPVLAGLFFAGLAKSVFDPALQAWVSRRIPFSRRGTAIGLMELAWAGSSLAGIPAAGFLIDRFGWRSPFFVLGAGGLASIFILARLVSEDPPLPEAPARFDLLRAWRVLMRHRTARAVLASAFLAAAANDLLFIVYGVWLETGFGLGILAIGAGAGVIGIAELTGEGLTAAFSDRFGLARSMRTGLFLSGAAYALLPFSGRALPFALAGIFLIFLFVEFTIVTSISFTTEILPELRATMLSAFFAAAGLGRVAGTMAGGPVWALGGIEGVCILSASLCALAFVIVRWGTSGIRG